MERDDIERLRLALLTHYPLRLLFLESKAPDHLSIAYIGVMEGCRGRGHGTAVMCEIMAWADERGVTLTLTPGNLRLHGWYVRLGFVRIEGGVQGDKMAYGPIP